MTQVTIDQAMQIAIQHQLAGRLSAAEGIYRQVLGQQPDHPGALHLLGVIANETGRNDVAADLIRRAIRIKPGDAEAHYNLGNALRCQGRRQEAIAAYRQAVKLNPGFAQAWNNLGNELRLAEKLDEAVAACSRAIALSPGYAEANNNLGIALNRQGKLQEAIAAGQTAVRLRPDYPEAYTNLGVALSEAGEFNAAIDACRRAIQLRPGCADFHSNLGVTLRRAGQVDEAVGVFRRAINIRPDLAESYSNLGNALQGVGQLSEAIAAHRQANVLNPAYAEAGSNLIRAIHFHPAYDAQAIAEETRRWERLHAEPLRRFVEPHPNDPNPERRLRVGYVSPDFREHVVGYNLLPFFRLHDHERFDVTCYAQVACPDAMTRQFQQYADGWRSTVGDTDEQFARQVRADRIDLLVDLALHTSGNRLLVFARKPAPVQASYLGYPSTTGLRTIDYRLSDPYLDPPGTDLSCYSEKTLRLPGTYWCYEPGGPTIEPSEAPTLKNGFVTFGCLNDFAKVSGTALDLWATVLASLPNARIIIHAPPGNHLAAVIERFRHGGVEANRLRFVGKQSWADYAQTYSQIDIALDPFPHCGGITTCDALWMGVPVVSLCGQTAVGRGGRSILSNLGLEELLAFTPHQYVKIAIDLARDPDRMAGLRKCMRHRMLASPLSDARSFARDVEAAYRQMWRAWCAREARNPKTPGGMVDVA